MVKQGSHAAQLAMLLSAGALGWVGDEQVSPASSAQTPTQKLAWQPTRR